MLFLRQVELNMKHAPVFRLVAKLCAAELVTAAYLGILGRPPDDAGLRAHCAEFGWRRSKSGKALAELLAAMSRSPERWQRSLEQRADELVRGVFATILEREPLEEELRTLAAQLRTSSDLFALIAGIATSQEHWKRLLEARSEELVLTLYRLMFGRDPASGVLKTYASRLRESGDLSCVLAAIGASQEFWQQQVAHRAGDLVRAAYRSLLSREPEDTALKSYAEQLKEHKSLEQTLSAIAQSQEHRDVVQRESAEDLVRAAFVSLLEREPEEAALKAYADNLRRGQSLREVLSEVGHSKEHWQLLRREHAEETVTALFRALLKRDPDSAGLEGHAAHFRASNDLEGLISAIGNSREHEMMLRKDPEWPHPARSYNERTWVFLHVEKTGGTSLQNMLLQSFGAAQVYNEHNDLLHLHSPAELSMYSVFAGHFNYDSLAFIPRRELKLFTFVREPMQRLLSLYHFWRSHDPSAPRFHESMKRAQELSIEAYYASSDVGRWPSTWNHMTWSVMGERQWRQWRRLLAGVRGEKRARVIESLRAPIRERLQEFCFVGLQENFAASCRELFCIMGRPCPEERADHSVEQLSTTSAYIRKTDRPVLTPRALEVMADLVELDAILYEEAKTLYALRLARRRSVARAQARRDSTHGRSRPRAAKSARNA
jgi:hypothetical protein